MVCQRNPIQTFRLTVIGPYFQKLALEGPVQAGVDECGVVNFPKMISVMGFKFCRLFFQTSAR